MRGFHVDTYKMTVISIKYLINHGSLIHITESLMQVGGPAQYFDTFNMFSKPSFKFYNPSSM